MPLMTWDDSFSVGVRALDDQHKGLVKTLNALHAAMLGGKSRSAAGPLLDTLVRYTREHFATEEELMNRTRYPELARHQEEHRNLTQEVQEYLRRFQNGEATVSMDLLKFLQGWLMHHILHQDREYGPWLNQHGVF